MNILSIAKHGLIILSLTGLFAGTQAAAACNQTLGLAQYSGGVYTQPFITVVSSSAGSAAYKVNYTINGGDADGQTCDSPTLNSNTTNYLLIPSATSLSINSVTNAAPVASGTVDDHGCTAPSGTLTLGSQHLKINMQGGTDNIVYWYC